MHHGQPLTTTPIYDLDAKLTLMQGLDMDDRDLWDGLAAPIELGRCTCHARCVCANT
jgi:hypothetical protein